MNWADERYVRLYTRDTVDWLALSFEAQGLLSLLLRKMDRAGVIRVGKHGRRGVAAAIGQAHRWAIIEPALDELLADGVISLTLNQDAIVSKNFIHAQEAIVTDASRKRAQRERERDKAPIELIQSPAMSRYGVTPSVTLDGHAMASRREVTPNLAVPSLAEPKETYVELDSTTLVLMPTNPGTDSATEVFDYWRKVLNHPKAAFDKKRRAKVEAQLKAGKSVADLKLAIDGCGNTPHNNGTDPKGNGQRYDDLELICRDASHVERFMANATTRLTAPQTKGRASEADRDWTKPVVVGLNGQVIF